MQVGRGKKSRNLYGKKKPALAVRDTGMKQGGHPLLVKSASGNSRLSEDGPRGYLKPGRISGAATSGEWRGRLDGLRHSPDYLCTTTKVCFGYAIIKVGRVSGLAGWSVGVSRCSHAVASKSPTGYCSNPHMQQSEQKRGASLQMAGLGRDSCVGG